MPWKVAAMSEIRLAFVHYVRSLNHSVTDACRTFGISRKTGYKWLARHQADPDAPLQDLSRRPCHSPLRTNSKLEQAVLKVRDDFGWGPRKIHAFLHAKHKHLPSVRTVANILTRHQRIQPIPAAPLADQRFERARPNELWQCDFKGGLEVDRQRVFPFTVLDDHSRFLFAIEPCLDQTMLTAWNTLWNIFGDVGLPDELLCDHAFGDHNGRVRTLSWFEARLVRLGIHPCHGRPYHPQTQGKLERLHGTLEREVWPRIRRDRLEHFAADVTRWRTKVYNVLRPHEALQDQPPLSRWRPSPRRRPAHLPEVSYPPGATLRRVSSGGDISWHNYRILAGAGLTGELVEVREHDHELILVYADYPFRRFALSSLSKKTML
jgi:transposase